MNKKKEEKNEKFKNDYQEWIFINTKHKHKEKKKKILQKNNMEKEEEKPMREKKKAKRTYQTTNTLFPRN